MMLPSVVLCFDKNYAGATCTLLSSLFINNPQRNYNVELLCSSFSDELGVALKKLEQIYQRDITVHHVNDAYFSDFKVMQNIPIATYLRFMIPQFVKTDKILYVDCDVIIQADISHLFDSDNYQNPHMLYGVPDIAGTERASAALQLPENDPYLNAGVLRFSNNYWRDNHIVDKILQYYRDNTEKITWLDQCAINGALATEKMTMDSKFNTLYQDLDRGLTKFDAFDAASFNGIFHFNSVVKPWHTWCKQPYKQLWDKYAEISPLRMTGTKPRTMAEWYLQAEIYQQDKNFEDAASIFKNLYNMK
jgi:lipopolysaccharide biosynthesis glycosyltransferase